MDVSQQLLEFDGLYAAIRPERIVPLEYELAFLAALDLEPVAGLSPELLMKHSQTATQLLVNALFELPIQRIEDQVVATLPKRTNTLPRGKPIPKQKTETRWEKFAAAKGIQKIKKKRVQFDESTGEFRPTFGYKNQGNADKDLSDWVKEVPANADQTVDLFETQREEKKGRVDKNKMQQLRNEQEASADSKGLKHNAFKTQNDKTEYKSKLVKKILDSKISTASMGKFDKKLDNDNVKVKREKRKVIFFLILLV
jgi:regulator of ribosome biosynthesis